MRQKIFFCAPNSSSGEPTVPTKDVENYLSDGWKVVSITPQFCAVAAGGQTYSASRAYGGFIIIIEKPEIHSR